MSRFTHFLRQYFGEQSCYKAILDFLQLWQSCKNLGRVVALLQGNFEKSHDFKANFEREKTRSFDAITKT